MMYDHGGVSQRQESLVAAADNTTYFLGRWQDDDDRDALDVLIARHMQRIREMVEPRLSAEMRQKLETGDIVQEAVLEFLRYGPPFRIQNGRQFRRLMAIIVTNVIRDQYERFRAMRRDMKRDLGGQAVDLDQRHDDKTSPGDRAAKNEMRQIVRLAMELMEPRAREVMIARNYHGMAWEEISSTYEFPSADAARQFRNRSRKVLRKIVDRITQRDIQGLIEERESQGGSAGDERSEPAE
ncbi:MAG: sigma-70 family RNA polymerase sigma factor [Planctomycetes bacterium]|nr:sigma-70 family RNA polymerase sigma factor [Planctomycetota bacterium]